MICETIYMICETIYMFCEQSNGAFPAKQWCFKLFL